MSIASRSVGEVKVWNYKSGNCFKTITHQMFNISSLTKLNSTQIITVNGNKSLKKWDIYTGECLKTFSQSSTIKSIIKLNRNQIASSSDTEVLIWELDKSKPIKIISDNKIEHNRYNNFNNMIKIDKSKIASSSYNNIIISELSNGNRLKTLKGHIEIVTCIIKVTNSIIASGSISIKTWI